MKMMPIALVAASALFCAGSSWAQSGFTQHSWSNSSNTGNFGGGSFTQTGNNMTISQRTGNGADSFCQFFSYAFGMTKIIQIITGNSMTQVFGADVEPVEDPCR